MSIMEIVEPLAVKLKDLDDKIKLLNSQAEELKSEREKISDDIVTQMQAAGIETSIGLTGGGFVKMDVQAYPTVLNLDGFISWANDHAVILPAMTFNASTLKAWWKEQMENSNPVPSEDLVKLFIKTRAKVTKGG